MNALFKTIVIALVLAPVAAFAQVGVSVGANGAVEGGTSGAARSGTAAGASIGTNSVNENRLGARLDSDTWVDPKVPSAAVDTRMNSEVYDQNARKVYDDNARRRMDADRAEMERRRGSSQIGVGIDASGGSSVNKTIGAHGAAAGSVNR